MCDFSLLAGLLTAASLAITAAAVLIGIAILTNSNFFTSGGSVALMIAAGLTTLAAVGSLTAAAALVNDFFDCMARTRPGVAACQGDLTNFINNLLAIITVLSAQALACFATAAIAWIPWAGSVPMYGILGALVVQAALIPSLTAYFNNLRTCVNSAAGAEVIPGWPIIFLVLATLAVVVVSFIGLAKVGFFKAIAKAFSGGR